MEEYYCRKCGMVVGSEYHFCSICGTSSFVRRGKNEEMQILGTINYPTCEFCGVNFINQIELDTHLKSIHTCNICNQKFETENERNIHYNSHPQCNICGMRFITLNKYEEHISYHNLKCEFCGENFDTSIEVIVHLRSIHLCHVCNQNFKTKNDRDNHYNSHPNCEICQKRFMTKYEYEEHISLHQKCKFCNKLFVRKKQLDQHIKKFHKNMATGISPKRSHNKTKSDISSSKNKCELNEIEQIDLICHFCEIKFNSSYEYEDHMKIHPICIHCGKRIYNEEILNKHIQGLL